MVFAKSGGVLTINLNKDDNDADATLKFSLSNYVNTLDNNLKDSGDFTDVLELWTSGENSGAGAIINLADVYKSVTTENEATIFDNSSIGDKNIVTLAKNS